VRDFVLTDGAIRNRYACLPAVSGKLRDKPVTLLLPDGEAVQTQLVKGRQVRWRGWGALYTQSNARPGDRVRFVAAGPRRYRVSIAPSLRA